MFKAKSKSIIIVSISWVIVITTNIGIFAKGNSISYDAGLEKAINLTYGTRATSSDKSTTKGDIFMSNYKYISSPDRSSVLNALNSVRKNIIGNPTQCTSEPTDKDILLILSFSKVFQQQMYTISDIPLSTKFTLQGNLTESCQKILYCLGFDKQKTIDSQKELQNCQEIVYQKYILLQELGSSYLGQPNSNRNDNIFIDGDKDNAPFDIMHDIENIKKVLFADKNSPVIPEMIYYSMPSVTIPGSNNNPTIPGGISAFGGASTLQNGSQSGSNSIIDISGNNNGNNGSALSSTDISIQDFMNSNSNNNSINNNDINSNSDEFNKVGNISIQSSYCPAPGSNSNNGSNINNIDDGSLNGNEFEQVQDDLFNALSGFLYYGSGIGDITDLNNVLNSTGNGNNGNENVILTEEPSNESKQCSSVCESSTGEIEKQICEGKCCISSCSTIGNISKKAICISQCLCGEFKTKNDEIRIRFCRVPAQPARVIPNRYVTTVEEAIDAISSIFKKLKQNNRMGKRNKTKELLDTSFSKIKLNQILSFNIFIAIKPIFNKVSIIVQKEEKIKKDKSIQQSIHPTGVKFGDVRDKNKYIIIGSNAKVLAEKTITTSFNDFNNNMKEIFSIQCQQQGKIVINGECKSSKTEQKETIDNASHEKTSALINEEFYKFMDQNYLFWNQTAEQINSMLQTSQTLKKKAESAK